MNNKITNAQVFKDLVLSQTITIERLFGYIDSLKKELAFYKEGENQEEEFCPQKPVDHIKNLIRE